MSHIIIGTAGHVDHGKTCLIRALTGIDTDRLSEEKKRGITIDLGFAWLETESGERIGIVDVPGHEKFIRNMLAGAGGIDLALLVVAADEGVMPQTREHLNILSLLNIKRGIVAITKTDMVDEEWLALLYDDVKTALRGTFLENAPMYPASSKSGEGIPQLRRALIDMAASVADKDEQRPFRLPVDRVFSMQGFGTVVTGTLIEGRLTEGEDVRVYPLDLVCKVRSIQIHARPAKEAHAGQRVAVNLTNVKTEDIPRGVTLAPPGSMSPAMMLDTRLQVLPDSPYPVQNNSRLHFHHGSSETLCKVVLLGGVDALMPGDESFAQLRFETPVACKAGDAFVLRFYSPLITVGGGVILDPNPKKHKAGGELAVRKLSMMDGGTVKDQAEALILEGSPTFVPRSQWALKLTCRKEEIDEAIEALLKDGAVFRLADQVLIHQQYADTLAKKAAVLLTEYHAQNPLRQGMREEEMRARLTPVADASLSAKVFALLADQGVVERRHGCCALPGFSIALTDKQAGVKDMLMKRYEAEGYSPTEKTALLNELKKEKEAPRVLAYLLDAGLLFPVSEEIFFTAKAYRKACDDFTRLASEKGAVTLADFRDALGTSRKYALAILEYWDARGYTKKGEDARTLQTPFSADAD